MKPLTSALTRAFYGSVCQAVLIVFFILFSVVLIATLKQKPVYRAQALLEIQKENPDIPTIQELYELDSVPPMLT